MDEQLFQTQFNDLLQRMNGVPDAQGENVEAVAGEATERQARIRASMTELQDAIDHLRLSVKYLVFDLEATRRENAYLRGLLEQANHVDDVDDEEMEDEMEDGLDES